LTVESQLRCPKLQFHCVNHLTETKAPVSAGEDR
jgi:hypothetical protein